MIRGSSNSFEPPKETTAYRMCSIDDNLNSAPIDVTKAESNFFFDDSTLQAFDSMRKTTSTAGITISSLNSVKVPSVTCEPLGNLQLKKENLFSRSLIKIGFKLDLLNASIGNAQRNVLVRASINISDSRSARSFF